MGKTQCFKLQGVGCGSGDGGWAVWLVLPDAVELGRAGSPLPKRTVNGGAMGENAPGVLSRNAPTLGGCALQCHQHRRSRAAKRSSSAHTSAMRPTMAKRSVAPSRMRSTRTGRAPWLREPPDAARRGCVAGKRVACTVAAACRAGAMRGAVGVSLMGGTGGQCSPMFVRCRVEKKEKVSCEARTKNLCM